MKRAIPLSTSSIWAAIAAAALVAIALVGVASGNSALAATSVVNGNFETGDLTGWTVDTTTGGDANALASYCTYYYGCEDPSIVHILPAEGPYFALLQEWGNPSEYTKMISQPFKASNGDKVSGWAFSLTNSNDKAQVVVKNASGTTVAKPYEESVNSEWKYWEHSFAGVTGEGEFQIEARVGSGVYWGSSSMGLDDVKTGINDAPRDTTKPSTSATRSVEPTADGWNKEDVTVKLDATDNEGGWGVKEITYSINGGQPTTEVGDSVEIPAITDEGVTTIRYYATDEALNSEDEQSLKVNIDKTPPQVDTYSASPADKATGVSPSAKISISFFESGSGIRPSTLNNDGFTVYKATRFGGSERVSGTISCDDPCKTATFTPKSRLGKGTYYASINAPGYVTDRADNVLANGYDWSFSVG